MNFKKLFLLEKIKLPNDIIQKIKDYLQYVLCIDCYRYFKSNTCRKCNSCQKWLCETHAQRALDWEVTIKELVVIECVINVVGGK